MLPASLIHLQALLATLPLLHPPLDVVPLRHAPAAAVRPFVWPPRQNVVPGTSREQRRRQRQDQTEQRIIMRIFYNSMTLSSLSSRY